MALSRGKVQKIFNQYHSWLIAVAFYIPVLNISMETLRLSPNAHACVARIFHCPSPKQRLDPFAKVNQWFLYRPEGRITPSRVPSAAL